MTGEVGPYLHEVAEGATRGGSGLVLAQALAPQALALQPDMLLNRNSSFNLNGPGTVAR